MVKVGTAHLRLFALVVVAATLFSPRPACAQVVTDNLLGNVQVVVQSGCAILRIIFNIRFRYIDHQPLDRGVDLQINLTPIDQDRVAATQTLKHETATVPDGRPYGINTIDLDIRNRTSLVLRILFDRSVAYRLATGSDSRSIVVAIAGTTPSPTCKPIFPGAAYTTAPGNDQRAGTGTTRQLPNPSTGAIADPDLRVVAASMDEGRAALRRSKMNDAIRLFTKVLRYPENQYSAEAQELLGLAYQKSGQFAQAQAEYEEYLRRYPGGEQSERVRQRLAGVITATGESSAPLRTPNAPPVGAPPIGQFAPLHDTTWTLVGGASTFYIRDDSFRVAQDPTLAPDPSADPDAHRTHQNEMLSTLDLIATWSNAETSGRIRFSGGEEHRFQADQTDEIGVSALSIDAVVKNWNLRTVAGRQTLNGNGVLGRFDGALFSWQPLPILKVDLVGGSPASSRYDLPFKNERYFYGAALGLGPFFGGLETSVYAIEQRDRWMVDREAFGLDLRYIDLNKFVFGTVDYDVRVGRLNAAIISGSWTLPDASTIYGGADYRRTPYLSTWNALLNKPFATLYDMLKAENETSQQLQQLEIDQTPIYKSAMIGVSHPLSEKLQIGADATIVNLSQPISPIGLDPALAALSAGNEYYYSAQITGNNIFMSGDTYVGAFRYSRQPTEVQYVLDLSARYPIANEWLLTPRVRLGYASGIGIDLKQYTVLPSFLIDYRVTDNLSFEAEIGTQFTSGVQGGIKTRDTELFATIGLRYSFGVGTTPSGQKNGSTPASAALCRYTAHPDGANCGSRPPAGS